MRSLRDYDQSLLWKRLDEISRSDGVDRAAVDHLKASVRKIAEHASSIELPLKSKQRGEDCVIIGHWCLAFGISQRSRAEEVIENYFTQIGKSFNRSPEFNQK